MNTLVLAPLARSVTRGLRPAIRRLLRGRARPAVAGLLLVCAAAGILVITQTTTTASEPIPTAPMPAAPVQVSAPTAATPAVAAPATTTITVHRGDTLWALARHYRTTVADLRSLNQLGNSSLIRAGAALHVPADPAQTGAGFRTAGTAAPFQVTASSHQITSSVAPAQPVRAPSAVGKASVRQIAGTVFGSEYGCAANIISRESGWNIHATNPSSGAYGLAQALPGSKMARSGPAWRTDPATQLAWMRDYVTARYGGACNAWGFWQAHHWY